VADLLRDVSEGVKALAGDWTKYTVIGSFLLYVIGYLALRFHLTAMGIGTDLAVLDERYLFTGARFLVYLISSVPNILLIALLMAAILWPLSRLIPATVRTNACAWFMQPMRLASLGVVFALLTIQFVMRQCFVFSDLLLAPRLPAQPAWLVALLLDDRFMPLYFSFIVAACVLPLAILASLRHTEVHDRPTAFAKGLLAFLAAVQILLLPVNYGVLIVDKALPRVAALGERPLGSGEEAWLVWEGKDGVTFLLRAQAQNRRALVTVPRAEVKRMEILGFDRIVPRLFGP
jgi:hypothetical protein